MDDMGPPSSPIYGTPYKLLGKQQQHVKMTSTVHPFQVLVLPTVGSETRAQITALGADWKEVDQLEYPYEGKVKFEVGINKQCRYSKLHLWNQTEYTKMIYLDADTAVQKNMDVLFERSDAFAGVRDLGDVINTGVFVMKPSETIFEDMLSSYIDAPSYNRGDQGFLYWYFSNRTSLGVGSLAPTFNVATKIKGFAVGKSLIADAYVYHFTSETKPWSFHHFYHKDWRVNYHAGMFASWRKMDYEVSQLLKPQFDAYALPRHPTPLRQELEAYDWTNRGRQYEICKDYNAKKETSGNFPVVGKYSVAISVNNAERLGHVAELIRHYWTSEKLDMVYITWHNPSLVVPKKLKTMVAAGKLVILRQSTDSLSNRFNPIRGLRTEAVFIADDDIFITTKDIDFAFEVWEARRESIVGFYPRIHGYDSDGSVFYAMAGKHHKYSMILTKAMMISAVHLHAYTCVLAPEVHRFVDMGTNCEDIAMNFMVSGLTNAAPVCVDVTVLSDFGTHTGISNSYGDRDVFAARRDACVANLIELFEKDTLVVNREMVSQFRRNSYNQSDWSILPTLMKQEVRKVEAAKARE
ncbi:glycosyltransferase family 64 protein [Pseudohyphozyma bogoriensis]|nr:glycosyltransferase family 64 protein [Pseudohyphozyma bogoriensis]